MEKVKKVLDRIFIEGLSAMAQGLFATLIIGTIIQQIGSFIPGQAGTILFVIGKVAASLTGAGIGVAVAYKFNESPLVVVSAATAGMTGAFASKLLAGTVLIDGAIFMSGRTIRCIPCSVCRDLFRTSCFRKNESGYSCNTNYKHRNRFCCRADPWTADFRIYGVAWFGY